MVDAIEFQVMLLPLWLMVAAAFALAFILFKPEIISLWERLERWKFWPRLASVVMAFAKHWGHK